MFPGAAGRVSGLPFGWRVRDGTLLSVLGGKYGVKITQENREEDMAPGQDKYVMNVTQEES